MTELFKKTGSAAGSTGKAKSAPTKKAKPVEKKTKSTEDVVVAKKPDVFVKDGSLDIAMVLIRPHVTEKATDLSEKGVYAFEVNKLANKASVRHAIEKNYKVKPVKIAIINGKPKLMKNPRTGRVQVKKTGDKKALVYLKKGDKIEFV